MKRVLVAPLDWGLGHATRCIPVIRELQSQGCEVMLAGSGDSLTLLRQEFDQLRAFSLPGYAPRYPRHGSMVWTMARQLPRFLSVMADEHQAIENISRIENLDIIISDNRFGCWSRTVPSVFITHQSNIIMPRRFGWLQGAVRASSEKIIQRFWRCWVPDYPDDRSLAGDLMNSRLQNGKRELQFIGPLSRFAPGHPQARKYDIVAVFSGPEPQRTLLEQKVVPQLKDSGLSYRVVRGLPALHERPPDRNTFNALPSKELQNCIEAAGVVIARSGYSTIMDMQALGKKVIFIPTPGQTEQEYLAAQLKNKGLAYYMHQNEFHLATALRESDKYTGLPPLPESYLLRDAVASILEPKR